MFTNQDTTVMFNNKSVIAYETSVWNNISLIFEKEKSKLLEEITNKCIEEFIKEQGLEEVTNEEFNKRKEVYIKDMQEKHFPKTQESKK